VLEALQCLSWTVQGAPADDPLAFAAPKAPILLPPQTPNLLCSLPSTNRRDVDPTRRCFGQVPHRSELGEPKVNNIIVGAATRCRRLHDALSEAFALLVVSVEALRRPVSTARCSATSFHAPIAVAAWKKDGGRAGAASTDLVRQGKNVDHYGAGSNTHKQLRLCQDNEAPYP
jgi:hypothetical protein